MNIVRTQTDKLVVGTNDVSYAAPDISPTGTAVLNGPVYIGQPTAALAGGAYQGVLNISSNSAIQNALDLQPPCISTLAMKADGNVKIEGDSKTEFALEVSGGSNQVLKVHGDAIFTAISPQLLSLRFRNKADVLPAKPFDIEHPIKGDGHRLRHVSLEGPEAGVYYRGRLKESNTIELPSYWKGLVHEDSITVQLQPIGNRHYHLNVVKFDNEKIIISEVDDKPIDCFYHVYGERKDVNPIMVEYEGDEYPDPNFDKNCKVPLEDRNFADPEYRFPRNVTTN